MKTNLFYKVIAFLVIYAFFLSSCEVVDDNSKRISYESGEILVKNIINYYYVASQQINYENDYQLEFANLMTAENPDSVLNIEKTQIVDDVDFKIKVFSEFIALLHNLQKEEEISTNSVQNQMFSLLNVLDSCDFVPQDTVSLIKEYISANQYNKDIAIYEITNLMLKIYRNDVLEWKQRLNKSYFIYAQKIDEIPENVFDEEKLEQFVQQPYKGKETLISIYKLNLKQEVYATNSLFIDRTFFLLKTFMDINDLYFRFSESSPDVDYIEWKNEQIYNSLRSFQDNIK